MGATPSRRDALIGENHEILPFAKLSIPYQLAIIWYMSVDGCAWDDLVDAPAQVEGDPFSGCSEAIKEAMEDAIPAYVEAYGDRLFGVVTISTEDIKASVMQDEEIAEAFSTWDEYAAWYCASGKVPCYDKLNRWPVILSSFEDETLQDGWHRLHSYIRDGHLDIPAVFYP